MASRSARNIVHLCCHIAFRAGRAPLAPIGRAILAIGGAIPAVAINYGVLAACWMLHLLGGAVQGAVKPVLDHRAVVSSMRFWRRHGGVARSFDAVGALVANVYRRHPTSGMIHGGPATSYGGRFAAGGALSEAVTRAEAKPAAVIGVGVGEDGDDDLLQDWRFSATDLLDSRHVYADLVLRCVFGGAPGEEDGSVLHRRRGRDDDGGSLWGVAARNEQYVTYGVVVATLQLFLHLTGANTTTLFLPMLSQLTTGCSRKAAQIGSAVLVLVNTGGILGSAFATRQYGREAMCMISAALIVFCQVAMPSMVEAHAGRLGGGGGGGASARMTTGHAAVMFAAACAVSGGFSWSWGALFWAVPVDGVIRSPGQAAAAALGFGLGFAQLQCFALMLRQLKHAALAYYAVWIWS